MDQQLEDILERCKQNPNLSLQEIALLQILLTEAIEICKRVVSSSPTPPSPITCFGPLIMPDDADIEPIEVD